MLAATGGQTGWLNFPQLLQATSDVVALLPSGTLYFAKTSSGSYEELFDGDWQLSYSTTSQQWTVCGPAGGRWLFNGFNTSPTEPNPERGEFAGYMDPAGNQITAQYFSAPGTPSYELGRISSVSRNYLSSTNGNSAVSVIATFTYNTQGQLATATMTDTGSATDGTTTTSRVATYQYDTIPATSTSSMPFDNFGDLTSVTVNQGSALISQQDYRYLRTYGAGLSVLSMVFDTDNILRMNAASGGPYNPFTSTDTGTTPSFATLAYNVIGFALQGAGATITPPLPNGIGWDDAASLFAFTNLVWNIPQANNINPWFGIERQLPNMSGIDNPPEGVNSWSAKSVRYPHGGAAVTDYLNIFGQMIASSTVANGVKYYSYDRYDSAGRTILSTDSAAVNSINQTTLNAAVLNPSGGDFTVTDWNASNGTITETGETNGVTAANGTNGATNLLNTSSDSITPQIETEAFTYQTLTDAAFSITVVATDTVYVDSSHSDDRTTVYNYPSASLYDLQPTYVQETLPPYASGLAAASGTAVTMTTGTLTSTVFDTFGRPIVSTDADGYVTTTAYDNTAADTGLVIQTNTDTATLNLVDKVTSWDGLGRPLVEVDPDGHVTNYIYNDGANARSILSYIQGDDLADVVYYNASTGTTSDLTIFIGNSSSAAPSSAQAYPVVSLTQTIADYDGRTVKSLKYPATAGDMFNLSSGLTIAALNAPPYTATNAYDADGLLYITVDINGQRTETDHDQLGRVTQIVECNTAISGNTGAVVQVDSYTPASPGQINPDGLLMSITQITGIAAASNRSTGYFYDWQDDLVGTQSNLSGTFLTLNQAGDVLSTRTFATGTGAGQATIQAGAVPTLSGSILAETDDTYDDQGQLYASAVDWVDPNTFAVSTSSRLTTYTFRDGRGNVDQTVSASGLVTTDIYDGAGRLQQQTTGNRSGRLFTVAQTTYDGDGNAARVATQDNNDSGTPGSGPTYYVDNWYDLEDRPLVTANYGTDFGDALAALDYAALPVTAATATSALVTIYSYNDSANSMVQTDPRGIATYTLQDALGRTVTSVADYYSSSYGTATAASSSLAEDVNVPTNYVYNNVSGQLMQVNVTINTGQSSGTNPYVAVTTYAYTDPINPSLATAVSDPSGMSANGSASTPTPASTYFAYDWLGDIITEVDRYGDTHNYTYDAAGDQTSDWVSAFGPGIDQSVTKLSTGYDALGRPIAYNGSSGVNGSGGVVNWISRSYNGFGQITTETQTPFTQFNASTTGTMNYSYGSAAGGSSMTGEVYPDGRTIVYDYNGTDGQIGRVSDVANGTSGGPGAGVMESYSYLGLDTVIGRTEPMASGMTESTTLNQFGEIQNIDWKQAGNDIDEYNYAYDNDGNITGRGNVLKPTFNQNYFYDNLNHLTAMAWSGNGAFQSVSFTLDSQGNRLATNGVSASFNAGDEEAGEPSNAGGASTTVQVDGPYANATLTYDAWGRVVNVVYDGITIYNGDKQSNFYDALGRLVGTNTYDTSGNVVVAGSVTYYDIANNPVEVKPTDAPAGQPSVEYVWSAAGPERLVERNSVYGMFFPTTDGTGSVTAIFQVTDGGGNAVTAVVERYNYGADGQMAAYTSGWVNYPSTPTQGANDSRYGWNVLWHGQFYMQLYVAGQWGPSGGGIYTNAAGGGWYDPQHGRLLVPKPDAPGVNPYHSDAGTIWGSTWWAEHAAGVATVATVALAVTATIATAGALAPEAAATVGAVEAGTAVAGAEAAGVSLGTLAVSGAVGGAIGSASTSYAAGNSYKRIALDATVGAVAGAAGGAVGGAVAGEFCPAAIEGWVASGVAGGAVGGGIQGGYEGYMHGGWGGIAGGALQGAVTGGAFGGAAALAGYSVFRSLGLLDGLSCFPAGTEVAYKVEDRYGSSPAKIGSAAVARAVFLSIAIERITKGFEILARDEDDPFGPLRKCVVEKVFCRITFHLRVLTLRMSDGRVQTIYTTDEHPAYESETQWTPACELPVGGQLLEASGGLAVIVATRREKHPQGVQVFNVRVAEAHTYLVRAEGFAGEPIWVHNACNILENAENGRFRESAVAAELEQANPDASIQRERYLRDAEGDRLIDPLTGEARRIDLAVIEEGELTDLVEVTSMDAPKADQIAKENRIREMGDVYIRDKNTGTLLSANDVPTRLMRVP